MAVQGVWSEPFSEIKFPLTAKNTGNFLAFEENFAALCR